MWRLDGSLPQVALMPLNPKSQLKLFPGPLNSPGREKGNDHEGHEAHEGEDLEFEALSHRVIGCALEVHRGLGPGLLESAYEQCLAHELSLKGIAFKLQHPLPIQYKGKKLDCGFRADLVVADELIVELKSVARLLPIHEAQLMTYLI